MKTKLTLLTTLLLAPLTALYAADEPKLLPAGWDPNADADKVIAGWPFIYATMSVVSLKNLKTLKLEKVIYFLVR